MKRRWKKPSWLALCLVGFGIVAFSYLGFWQLRRAAEKELLLAAYAAAAVNGPVDLAEARRTATPGFFPRVTLRGRFDPIHTYLLDDQVRDGRQGVLAFAVLDPGDGSLPLLVNRGFVARDGTAGLPAMPPVPAGGQQLNGIYATAPGSGLRLGGNALPAQMQWPKLTIYIDTIEIGTDLGRPIDTRVLLLDADAASGFVREWTPQILPPERHRGYAFQWFCFALASVVIFIVLHWRRVQPGSK